MRSRARRLALLVLCSLMVPAASAKADPVSRCDPLDPSACMLPFPNDFFTKADPSTPTGRRIDFPLADLPRTAGPKPIDPAPEDVDDGFSPGRGSRIHV